MSQRKLQHATIIYIQEQIDLYSRLWVTTNSIHAYAQYQYYIEELKRIKLAILEHERHNGFDN